MLKKIIIYSDDGIISFLQDEKQFVSFIMGKFCPCGHTNNERSSIMSKEKTYLKWYNKVGYGSGDVAGNVVYALLTSFVMILSYRHDWIKRRCYWRSHCCIEDF